MPGTAVGAVMRITAAGMRITAGITTKTSRGSVSKACCLSNLPHGVRNNGLIRLNRVPNALPMIQANKNK